MNAGLAVLLGRRELPGPAARLPGGLRLGS